MTRASASAILGVMPRLLTDAERRAALGSAPPRRVAPDAPPPFDFWPYVETIPAADLYPHDFSEGAVPFVYASEHYQFVNIDSADGTVFLVIVLDVAQGQVHGHFVLDLERELGAGAARG